jgi:hypothetical protein
MNSNFSQKRIFSYGNNFDRSKKNNKAYQFIKFLEELNFLKILTKDSRKSKKFSEQFSGKLSKDTANKMIEELNQSRGEWEQRGL